MCSNLYFNHNFINQGHIFTLCWFPFWLLFWFRCCFKCGAPSWNKNGAWCTCLSLFVRSVLRQHQRCHVALSQGPVQFGVAGGAAVQNPRHAVARAPRGGKHPGHGGAAAAAAAPLAPLPRASQGHRRRPLHRRPHQTRRRLYKGTYSLLCYINIFKLPIFFIIIF